ncbi:MAG: DUF4442 domain-containing protein [Myxococcota bacterium]|jgi:acyl-coenzyme A thioesterase PaaI-like protein|nr:DUF4442 domain-containing protein [Myxococcota bacterium]
MGKRRKAFELNGPRLLSLWQSLHRIPGGKLIFSRLLGHFIPYTGALGAVVERLDAGEVELSLRERRGIRNHLSSVHAAALMNFLELSTGLAVVSSTSASQRAILLHFELSYEKKARGRLRAIGRCTQKEGKDWMAEGQILDERDAVVSRAVATWRVSD